MGRPAQTTAAGHAVGSVLLGLIVVGGVAGGGWGLLRSPRRELPELERSGFVDIASQAKTPGTPEPETQRVMTPEEIVTEASTALRAADQRYKDDVAHARALCSGRLDAAARLDGGPDGAAAIAVARKVLDGAVADPAVGVHHAESPEWPPKPVEGGAIGLPEVWAVLISYKADVELARRRWIDSAAAVGRRDLSGLNGESQRARQAGDAARAAKIQAILGRLKDADKGRTTTWYREPANASGKAAVRSIPVALEIANVQIGQAVVGEQLRGSFDIRTRLAAYRVKPEIAGPEYLLLLYDGDEIIYLASGGWNGSHEVGSSMRENLDTHSNTLATAAGKPFVFSKAGAYLMRLVLTSGGGWDDVLDVYEAQLKVASERQSPPTRPSAPGRSGRPARGR